MMYSLALRSCGSSLAYMWVGGNKVDCVWHWLRRSWRFALLLLLTCFATDALADGCFVFKWDKKIDINEPTQKAIIVFDAGREEILLQVKYEGPLEEFGWLVPTPSLPKVEKGSMEPFYELSQLTQRRFGRTLGTAGTKGMAAYREGREDVQVMALPGWRLAFFGVTQRSGPLKRPEAFLPPKLLA